MRWLSRLVSIVVVLALVVGFGQLIRRKLPTTSVGGDFHSYALMRDGSRIAIGSPVMIAGVRVGEVDALSIQGRFARVGLRLTDGIEVPRNSWLTKRASSAFGDNYLEIIPPDDEGAAGSAPLANGEPLTRIMEGGSTDQVLRAIGRALPRVDSALDNVHTALGTGRRWIDDRMSARAEDALHWVEDGKIEAALASADHAMDRLDRGTERAVTAVADAKPKVAKGLGRADDAIQGARDKIAGLKESLHDGLQGARDGLQKVDEPIANAQEVVAAINAGSGADWRGTLGRLVNDKEPGETIDDFVEDTRYAADGLFRFRSYLGMRGEWNVFAKQPRAYATAEFRSKNDRFYLFELERDSIGDIPTDDLNEAPGSPNYTRTVTIKDELRFTAQFGKQLGALSLRAGIKDSTPGVGADVLIDHGDLKLSLDVFGGLTDVPRVKLAAAFHVFRSIYLYGGIDDVFTKPGYLKIAPDSSPVPDEFTSIRYGRDYFLGAGLHFDDDDLVQLLRVYGALIVSAL